MVRAFAIAAVVAVAGCGGASQPQPLQGSWWANGLTRSAKGTRDARPGRAYERAWVIYRRCTDGRCELRLARQAAFATEDAPLVREDDGYRATFTARTEGCHTARTGVSTKVFHLDIRRGGAQIVATEEFAATFPGCSSVPGRDGRSVATTTWSAKRTSPSCPSGGCDYGRTGPQLALPQ